MTHVTVRRQRREFRLGRVTRKTVRVSRGDGPESSFLKPEPLTQIRGRFRQILLIITALWMIDLMTGRTRLNVAAEYLRVFRMWKEHAKLRVQELRAIAKRGETIAILVPWRHLHVAIGTDPGRRALAREELLAMAVYARAVFRKFGDIRKGVIAGPNGFPVGGWKLVTTIAGDFLRVYMSGVREL